MSNNMQQNATQTPENLTPKMHKAIVALLEGKSIEDAAKAAGVNRATLWRWFQTEGFRAAHHNAGKAVVDSAITKLQAATEQAADTLIDNLTCGNDFAENAAATTIISQSLKAIELRDLEARLEEVERQLKGVGARKRA